MKLHAILIFCVSIFIYTSTLYPGAGGSLDSAEFQISGKVLGISHPTGYPLYHLISYFISHIPIQTLAWRMSFLSAFWVSLSMAILFLVVYQTGKHLVLSYITILLLITSMPVWHSATITEVYAMQYCIHAFVILSYIQWLHTQDPKWIRLCSLGLGIGLAHHLMTVILIMGILFTGYCVPNKHAFDVRTSFISALWFVFPLLTFLYFPIVSSLGAHSFDYYEFHSFSDFIHYFLGGNNTNLLQTNPVWIAKHSVLNGISYLMQHWGVFPFLLSVIGLYEGIRSKRTEWIVLVWIASIHILLTGIWTEADREAVLVPALLCASVFMALGAQTLFKALQNWNLPPFVFSTIFFILFLGLFSINTYTTYHTISTRNETGNTSYYQNVYHALPAEAIVLTAYWEESNIMKYYAWSGEFEHKEIAVFRWNDPRSHADIQQIIHYLQGKSAIGNPPLAPAASRPVYFLHPPVEEQRGSMLTVKPIPLEQEGFIYQAHLTQDVFKEEKGYVPLAILAWHTLEWNWVEPRTNVSVNGNPLMIGDTLYTEGFGIHAGTKMQIPVPEDAKRFSFTVGVSGDLAHDAPSSIIAILSTNTTLLRRSPVLTIQSEGWKVDYPIQNETHLILDIWGTEDGLKADHAVLAEPRFYFEP